MSDPQVVSDAAKSVINLADVSLQELLGHGEAFQVKIGSFGRMIGSTHIGVMLHKVEPGKRAFPYHVHHQTEELFIVLEGEGTYRFGKASYPVKAGDILAAPSGGPEVAHQLINTGTKTLKYLGTSANTVGVDVMEYPDSGKFAVTSRYDWETDKSGFDYIGRTQNSLGYWEGE